MSSGRRTLITLSAALLLGAALGLGRTWEKQPSKDAATARSKGALEPVTDAGSSVSHAWERTSSVRSSGSSASDACAAAWELLKNGKLCRKDRRDLECDLMREWCLIDLRAALHAAFEEDETVFEDPFVESPLDACTEGIMDQTDLVWDLVNSREYGLHTRELRSLWIKACAETRPLEVMHRLLEIPADVRHEAIYEAASATHRSEDPAPGREEVAAAVLALRGTPDGGEAMEGFATGLFSALEAGELGAMVVKQQDAALRDLYLDAYVRGFKFASSTQTLTELEKLPAELRGEVESRIERDTTAPEGLFPVTEPQAPTPEE